MHKVPLVVYEDGERKIVGSAVVDLDGEYVEVTGQIDEPHRSRLTKEISKLHSVSLGSGAAYIIKEDQDGS